VGVYLSVRKGVSIGISTDPQKLSSRWNLCELFWIEKLPVFFFWGGGAREFAVNKQHDR
jgi:hypothetical protein